LLGRRGTLKDIAYAEVQMFGGVKLSDIAEIRVKSIVAKDKINAIKAKAKSVGITVSIGW
jgi:hypothetical protein